MRDDGKAWFAPKRHGYGAGLPIAWQGWAVLGAYLLTMIGPALLTPAESSRIVPWLVIYLPIAGIATLAVILISKRTTLGGWRWRGGEDD